jgi:threonine/homoserine/homoserine lactone efflux protein
LLFYFLQGAALALPATIMPGPFQAYLLSQALKNGWKSTLPAALAPLVTDGPIIALVLLVLTQTPQYFLDIIRIVGGIFILYLARGLFLNLRNSEPVTTPPDNAARQSFVNAVVMNALNPNPFIFWGVVAGPILLSGWRESPGLGISFMLGFYGTFVCSLAALILVFATAGRVNLKINRLLSFFAGSGLLAFGIYQMVTGLMAVIGGG